MVFVTLVKLVLVLYCRSFTNEIVKAYAQDHFFDVITNVIGLVAALLANYFSGWIDPVGAMIVSYISLMVFRLAIYNNISIFANYVLAINICKSWTSAFEIMVKYWTTSLGSYKWINCSLPNSLFNFKQISSKMLMLLLQSMLVALTNFSSAAARVVYHSNMVNDRVRERELSCR